nr:LEAF RUST 10 DISEASE-RESISTANCE LOCUS RECEPTOR-LIKE PROTEIN KINASE-like 1.1 [Ipomoea batatas]
MGNQSCTPTPSISIFFIMFYSLIIFLLFSGAETKPQFKCPNEFLCRQHSLPTFPFTNTSLPDCGLFTIDCNASPTPTLDFGGKLYTLLVLIDNDMLVLGDPILEEYLQIRSCDYFNWNSSSVPSFLNSSSVSFKVDPSQFHPFFKCNQSSSRQSRREMDSFFSGYKSYDDCKNFTLYYREKNYTILGSNRVPKDCSLIQLPFHKSTKSNELFDKLNAQIEYVFEVSKECSDCHNGGGQCQSDNNHFKCLKEKRNDIVKKRKPDVKDITRKNKRKMIEIAGTRLLSSTSSNKSKLVEIEN